MQYKKKKKKAETATTKNYSFRGTEIYSLPYFYSYSLCSIRHGAEVGCRTRNSVQARAMDRIPLQCCVWHQLQETQITSQREGKDLSPRSLALPLFQGEYVQTEPLSGLRTLQKTRTESSFLGYIIKSINFQIVPFYCTRTVRKLVQENPPGFFSCQLFLL